MTYQHTPPRPPVPDEIRGWNWGAFLLNWIWGVGNGVFIALLALIPVFGLVFIFVLGAKGSEWAWRNGRWDSVAHFKRVQRLWAIWGVVIWVGAIAGAGALVGGILYGFVHSDAYRMAVARLQANPEVRNAVGEPIKTGFPLGQISVNNGTGVADLGFSVSGPKGSGRAAVHAVKANGVWTLTTLKFSADDGAHVIDVLNPMKARFQATPSERPFLTEAALRSSALPSIVPGHALAASDGRR